tara:strand:- start:288 stop:1616 length:1329 start_codon:yes stop_codon:yes gene_type:complete
MSFLLIGQPNVGKSSIFNILTGKKTNIIHKKKETTRDWHKGIIKNDNVFLIYDTPGITFSHNSKIIKKDNIFIEYLIHKVNIFLFVVDYNSKISHLDLIILSWLRTFNKRIIILVNKKDNKKNDKINDFFEFGIKEIFFLSCTHRLGFNQFKDYINDNKNFNIKIKINQIDEKIDFSIAIFGKPNSGKSTFLNKVLGYNRSKTSQIAGTTTDYVVEYFKYQSKKIKIFDTSGIARQSKIHKGSIDYLSINKSFKITNDVDFCLLIIDSLNQLDRQDKRIINIISKKSKSLIIIFNKFDLIINKSEFKYNMIYEIENKIYQLKNKKVFFISSFNKSNVNKIINYIIESNSNENYNLGTSKINQWLKKSSSAYEHPLVNNKKVKFKYASIIKNNPITIKIFCNFSNKIHISYKRYLLNDFAKKFKILNQNINIIFDKSKNPFKN